MLIPIENILDKGTVAALTQTLEKAPWQDGRVTAGSQAVHSKSNLQVDDNCGEARTVGAEILRRLSGHPVFMSAALPHRIFPPKFNLYRDGGHYGLHVDNAVMHLGDGQSMRTDLSATLFLSDPDDYEGGELLIETHYGAQEVKLGSGDLILYPSTSLHEVRPVTSGARLCAFFWVQSMVKRADQREILFDLDQSVQVITAERGPTNDEVRRLSGIYHNLVRQWTEM